MIKVDEILADLERRVRAFKSNRPVHIRQINMLAQSFELPLTLDGYGGAEFEVTIECAGPPFVDVGYTGFGANGSGIIPLNTYYGIEDNTAVILCDFSNTSSTSKTATIVLTAYALNGLLASIRRLW